MAPAATIGLHTLLRTTLRAGLLAGTLDALAGMGLFYNATGRNPLGVFPYIASGVFGPSALTGGSPMLALGVLFHYLIALSFALFFVLLPARVSWLRRNWMLAGLLYGVFVWVVMNLGVLPLSNVTRGPFNLARAALNMAVLVISVGLPISWVTNQRHHR
ncbi:hypothetical protein [Fibrella arboris]|uniref:hypothetical protein n=1 Tax=Fibrella arboris TaxID=3242486 RepID=UPI003521CF38